MGQRENIFTAIAKTGKGESCLEEGGIGGRRGHTAASRTYTIFLLHPFPKPTVSVLSLWPRLCSNMKMESDKGRMLCRHLGNSGDLFILFFIFLL